MQSEFERKNIILPKVSNAPALPSWIDWQDSPAGVFARAFVRIDNRAAQGNNAIISAVDHQEFPITVSSADYLDCGAHAMSIVELNDLKVVNQGQLAVSGLFGVNTLSLIAGSDSKQTKVGHISVLSSVFATWGFAVKKRIKVSAVLSGALESQTRESSTRSNVRLLIKRVLPEANSGALIDEINSSDCGRKELGFMTGENLYLDPGSYSIAIIVVSIGGNFLSQQSITTRAHNICLNWTVSAI